MRQSVASPTAASLGKFGDVPVSLYTGVPDISIPLFTAKGRTLELPIVARYHAGGIRVEEVGGWLGGGWSLDAGGTITRTARGLVDESASGYYNTGQTWWTGTNWANPTALVPDIEAETIDGEPDQFFFNFAGRSGQMVMGPTSSSATLKEYKTIPYQKLRFVPTIVAGSITSWSVQTEDGTRYTFGAAEFNTDSNTTSPSTVVPAHDGEGYTSSWHLTQIRSPGGDIITLTYTPYTAVYKIGGYHERFDQITNSCVSPTFDVTNKYAVVAQRLTSITSAAQTITFVPGATLRTDALSPTGVAQEPRLDSMRVSTTSGRVLRRFQFAHDYSTGRLTLKNIFELDSLNDSLPPYTFTYAAGTLPAYSSNAQDHWGFYNAKTANTTLIPPAITPSNAALTGGDRTPDSTALKLGSLTRMTYPTGGYSEFVYEANDYGGIGLGGTQPLDGGPLQTISANSPSGQTGPINTPFTIGGSKSVIATVTVNLTPSSCTGVGCRFAAILTKQTWTTSGTYTIALAPGSYTAQASDEFSGGSAFISVSWRDSVSVKRKLAAGLRVAEIRTADAMGAITYRKYKYTLQADATKSSGFVSAEPAYGFLYSSNCQYYSRSSASRMPLGGGPTVGYGEVTVWQGASGEFGTTRHTMRSVLNTDDDPPSTSQWPYSKRTSREWKRGQETSATDYSASGVTQQKSQTSYQFRDAAPIDTVTTRNFRGVSIHAFSSGALGSLVLYNKFEVISAWTYQDSDTLFTYDTTGANAVATARNYVRANSKHLQLTQMTETNSDATQRITNLKYPGDYAIGSGNAEAIALTAMQDTFNMHGALVERWVIKRAGVVDSVVAGEVTSYTLASVGTSQYLPYQRFTFTNPAPLPVASFTPSAVSGLFTKDSRYVAQETATTYDAFGRVTALTDARNQSTSYLFGGNPNNAFLTKVTKTHDASGPIDLITNVAYGTDQNVSSIQDEGGTFRRFTYDAFGRLRQIQNSGSVAVKAYGYTYSRTSPSWTFNSASPNTVIDTTFILAGTSVVGTQIIDGLGRPIQSIVKDGTNYHVSATEYDGIGRLWRTWKPYTRTTAGYDASFNANATSFYNTYLGQTLAKPYVETQYRAEPMNRVAKVIPEYVGSSPAIWTLQGYGTDAVNKQRIAEATDESGKKTRSFTDVFGNSVKTILGFGAAEATTTVLTPNILGQRTKATDPRGLNTTYALDTRGLLTSRTSPDAGAVNSKYDKGQNLRFAQDANQAALPTPTVAFTSYDFGNRPLNSGVGTATFSSLDPDAAPTVLETTNTNWLVVRGYDAKPATANFPWSRFATQINLVTLSNVSGRLSAVASKSNGAWQVTLFSYDADGRVATRYMYTEANGGAAVLLNINTTVSYTRDLRDALTQRGVTTGASSWYQWYDYDTRGLLWKVSAATTGTKPGTPDVTYTYRPTGQVASRLFSGGPTVPFSYTIREQLAQIGDPAGTTYPFSAKYSYNANSTISTGEFYSGGSPVTNKRYKFDFPTYDALNRLKSADYSFWNGTAWTTSAAYDLTGITYDLNGNLTALQRNRDMGTAIDNLMYTIAASSNRLTSATDAVATTPETWDAETGNFTYDANGNQLTAPAPYSITATTYDPRNLPLSLTIAGTATTYRYDDAGQRITKQVGAGSTEVYLREGTTTLGVFTVNSGGTVTSSFFNLLAGDRVVGRQPSTGSRSYYHTDWLGSTRSVVQGATITESYDPDPWGVLMPGRTLGSGTKEGFTSKERDAESQMDYFGARYYLSALGRWGSVDPPFERYPEWAPYNYVGDDPVSRFDPLGLDGCEKKKAQKCTDRVVWTGRDAQQVVADLARILRGPEKVLKAATVVVMLPAAVVIGEGSMASAAVTRLALRVAPVAAAAGAAAAGAESEASEVEGGVAQVAQLASRGIASVREVRLLNGFYQVQGLPIKFSQYYYERLWSTGRGAPFLQAQEVLRTATHITPDRMAGFLRYSNGFLEMVYNPSTGEVWHLQPLVQR